MDEQQQRLRELPGVDRALEDARMQNLSAAYGREVAVYALRRVISEARGRILSEGSAVAGLEAIIADAEDLILKISGRSLQSVINASGVILHTNLGRAPLGTAIITELREVLEGYANLEFDLRRGARGKRSEHVVELLKFLTGAEDAVVVNNNAAGILLTINTLAAGREIVISRGELIEIGDSFRIPDVIVAGGAQMVEVGTTNRTHLEDYEKAISPRTALIFKAHTSNYALKGFTTGVAVKDLAGLARAKGLPLAYDVGSGLLRPHPLLTPHHEPDVQSALADGADLVLFSCDKLLGGPQGGIIAGRRSLTAGLARAPMMRALRVDKLTIAALSVACRHYLRGDMQALSPLFFFLQRSYEERERVAGGLHAELGRAGISCRLDQSSGQCGGGSLPDMEFKSVSVTVLPPQDWHASRESFAEMVFHALLCGSPAVLGVLRKGEIVLDLLAIREEEVALLARAVSQTVRSLGKA